MPLFRLHTASCAAAVTMLCGAALPARAQDAAAPPSFTFTEIDMPNATNTYVFGFGPNNSLVGSFYDQNGYLHGFTETKAGVFKQFDVKVKGAISSAIQAKTAAGTLAQGYFNTTSGQIAESFFIDPNGKIAQIAVPKAKQTLAWGMNKSGTIVGRFIAADNVTTEAFIYQNGKYTTFKQPGMSFTEYNGINDNGVIVGAYQAQPGQDIEVGFILKDGKMTTVEHPGVTSTTLQGINNAGEVIGFVRDFYNRSNAAFVYKSGVITDINVGVPDYVWGFAIDSKGNIAGADIPQYTAASGFVGKLN